MNLKELISRLNETDNDKEKCDLIEENFILFEGHEDELVPYLDSILIYCDNMNCGFLELYFREIKATNSSVANKMMDIMFSCLFDDKCYLNVFKHFTEISGSFAYEYDASLETCVDRVVYGKETNKYFDFVKVSNNNKKYLLVFRK